MKNEFGDSIKVPQPETKEAALRSIQKLARDKGSHVLLTDHVEWLELKLKAISIVATRGRRVGRVTE